MTTIYSINAFRSAESRNEKLNEIMMAHEKLVGNIVKRYFWAGDTIREDLMQAGRLGLLQACENYRNDRGTKFSTYAYMWIERNVRRELAHSGYPMKVPEKAYLTLSRVKQAKDAVMMREGRATTEAIAEEAEISAEKAYEALCMLERLKHGPSFNQSVSDEEESCTLLEIYRDPNAAEIDADMLRRESAQEIRGIMKEALSEKEEMVLRLRYGFEPAGESMTYGEIGNLLSCAVSTVYGIEARALKKLRDPRWAHALRDCRSAA